MEIDEATRVPTRQTGAIYRQLFSELRRLTGATAVSLYIESSIGSDESPLLLHGSATGRIPEFESIDAAERAIHRLSRYDGRDPLPAIKAYPGLAHDSCLIRIRVGHEPLSRAEPRPAGEDRRRRVPTQADASGSGYLWIGLRFDEGTVPLSILELDPPTAGRPGNDRDWLAFSLLSSANLVWEGSRIQLLTWSTAASTGTAAMPRSPRSRQCCVTVCAAPTACIATEARCSPCTCPASTRTL